MRLIRTAEGRDRLTDAVIRKLNEREKPLVFILWGSNAKSKLQLITNKKHLVIAGVLRARYQRTEGFSEANTSLVLMISSRDTEYLRLIGI